MPADTVLRARIRAARQARNESIDTVAARAGLSAEGLRLIEVGRRQPRIDTLARIAKALDLPFEALVRSAKRRVSA